MEKIDRYRGCLVGLAVGDALGAPLEGRMRHTYSKIVYMEGGGRYDLPAGTWTDDTSMALCLATSLIEKGTFDLEDQINLYVKWYVEGFMSALGHCFGIGRNTRQALERYQLFLNPYAGSIDINSAGNGSIMRLAPIPMFYGENLIDCFYYSGESSRTTHQAPEAIQCCQLFGSLICCALNGLSKEEILDSCLLDFSESKVLDISKGTYKNKTIEEIKTTAYVIDSLEAALWCFYRANNFDDGLIEAINLGGDTDTIGAIYGQLAGAYWGIESINSIWVNKLYAKDEIIDMAEKLYELSKNHDVDNKEESEDVQFGFNEKKNSKELGCQIFLQKGDITKLEVDVIVNAAHDGLTGGGGVDGAIHNAAGPQLAGECANLYGCPTGEARITSGYNLLAKYVIHTVGPVYVGTNYQAEQELEDCYTNCLKMAEMQGLKSIAFPCISTGAYCFNKDKAALIALDVIKNFIKNKTYLKEIHLVCFDEENYQIYKQMLNLE